MPQVFNSFYHEVSGNEAERCHYPTRLDTYGCGCQHNCGYCYARSLLAFRGLWNAVSPAHADLRHIVSIVKKLRPNSVIRLGGMTDCFQPIEKGRGLTLRTIQMLNKRRVHYLIVTKGDLIGTQPYLDVMDKELAHIQVSVTSTNDEFSGRLEPGAPLPEARLNTIKVLKENCFDVAIRLSPYLPELIDLSKVGVCDKVLVEFLRVNTWIEKWVGSTGLPIDLTKYQHFSSGYKHLPLTLKREYLKPIQAAFPQVSVCEDVPEHWEYWKRNVNYNHEDCCNINYGNKEN